MLSRAFTFEDTHDSISGDLLILYKDEQHTDELQSRRVEATKSLLGLEVPSFTYATDVVLPVSANEDLRIVLTELTAELDREPDDMVPLDNATELREGELLSAYSDIYLPQVCR